VEFSICVKLRRPSRAPIEQIPEGDWQPLKEYPPGGEAPIAETKLGGWRLIVRVTAWSAPKPSCSPTGAVTRSRPTKPELRGTGLIGCDPQTIPRGTEARLAITTAARKHQLAGLT
jgi:hypothetical protein